MLYNSSVFSFISTWELINLTKLEVGWNVWLYKLFIKFIFNWIYLYVDSGKLFFIIVWFDKYKLYPGLKLVLSVKVIILILLSRLISNLLTISVYLYLSLTKYVVLSDPVLVVTFFVEGILTL